MELLIENGFESFADVLRILLNEAMKIERDHALDVAKALIDRGFHPPTIYFPTTVHDAIMIEPTETESKESA